MKLRKLSQQTYFKSKQSLSHNQPQQQQLDVQPSEHPDSEQPEEPQELLTAATPKKDLALSDVVDSKKLTPKTPKKTKKKEQISATSQLLRKFKNNKKDYSPTFKTEETTQFNQSTSSYNPRQSKKEQEEVIERLIKWGKKKEENLEKSRQKVKDQEMIGFTGKPEINQELLKLGMKKYAQIETIIKKMDAEVQTLGRYEGLQKLSKYKNKVVIEYDLEYEQNVQNEQSCQVNFLEGQAKTINVQEDLLNQSIVSKTNTIDSQYTIPISMRLKYEEILKCAKIEHLKQQREIQFEELGNKKRMHSQHISFNHFIQEQEAFEKKRQQNRQQKYEEKLKKELEQESSFKPTINTQYKSNCDITKTKFNDRVSYFQRKKLENLQREKESSLPSFQPQISTKSKKLIDSKLYNSQMDEFE